MTPLRQRMIEDMKLRNVSASTQDNYVRYVADLARYFGKSPELLGPEEIRAYQLYLVNERDLCANTMSRMTIRVDQGKGKKDRYVMLSPRLLKVLRIYWMTCRPQEWLFPGAKPGKPISVGSVDHVCRQARIDAGTASCLPPRQRPLFASGPTPNTLARNWDSWPSCIPGTRPFTTILIFIASYLAGG